MYYYMHHHLQECIRLGQGNLADGNESCLTLLRTSHCAYIARGHQILQYVYTVQLCLGYVQTIGSPTGQEALDQAALYLVRTCFSFLGECMKLAA